MQSGDMDDVINPLPSVSHGNANPTGTIIAFMGTTAPDGYLACNGATKNIADYPRLANFFLVQFGSINKFGGDGTTTFKVPDLRGEFLRGISTNGHTGEGNGARVGEHQDGTEIPYNMLSANGSRSNGFVNSEGTSQQSRINASADKLGGSPNKLFQIVTTEGTLPSGLHEYYKVRPTNTSVVFCIATKNIYLNPSLDYSTEEKVVGTWIDNRPVYQRTISDNTTTINVTNFVSLSQSISNVSRVINAIVYIGTGTYIPCLTRVNNGNVEIKASGGIEGSAIIKEITLQYIKTT